MRFSKIKLARCRKCKWYKFTEYVGNSIYGKIYFNVCKRPEKIDIRKISKKKLCRAHKKNIKKIPLICFHKERIRANENTKRNAIQ